MGGHQRTNHSPISLLIMSCGKTSIVVWSSRAPKSYDRTSRLFSAHSARILTGSFSSIGTLYCPHQSQMICSVEGMDESLEFYRLPLASSYKMCTLIITNGKGYSKPRVIVFLAGFCCLSWCQFLHVSVLPLVQKRHSTAVL